MFYIVISINNILTYKYASYNELQNLTKNNVKWYHIYNNGLLYFK